MIEFTPGSDRGAEREETANAGRQTVAREIPETEEIPDRSRLYPIKSEGVGTPRSECLSGYISGLAFEHLVTPGDLIAQKLSKDSTGAMVPGSLTQRTGGGSYFRFFDSYSINGWGATTKALISGLELGTQLTGFEHLTMIAFEGAISAHYLFQRFRRWCPACYEESRRLKRRIYDLLLWTLTVVMVCTDHAIPLEDKCVACGTRAKLFSGRHIPGFCSNCFAWLGGIEEHSSPIDQQNIAIAKNVGALIANIPDLSKKDLPRILERNMFACAEVFADGHFPTLARLSQSKGNSIGQYPRQKPSLENLLGISLKFGFPLTELFSESPSGITKSKESHKRSMNSQAPASRAIPGSDKRMDDRQLKLYEQTKSRLDVILARAHEMTHKEIAREAGVSRSYLTRNFPEEYAEISSRAGRPRLEAQRAARDALYETVLKLTADEIQAGDFPSVRYVQARLTGGRPRWSNPVHAALTRARTELTASKTEIRQNSQTENP